MGTIEQRSAGVRDLCHCHDAEIHHFKSEREQNKGSIFARLTTEPLNECNAPIDRESDAIFSRVFGL